MNFKVEGGEEDKVGKEKRQEEALKVLETDKPTVSLTQPECNILLQCHEVPNPMNGKLVERRKR